MAHVSPSLLCTFAPFDVDIKKVAEPGREDDTSGDHDPMSPDAEADKYVDWEMNRLSSVVRGTEESVRDIEASVRGSIDPD